MTLGGHVSAGVDGEVGPKHLFFNDLEELHPWRMPSDCIRGCMALPTSVDFLLRNVAAAREKSFNAMYKVRPSCANGIDRSDGYMCDGDGATGVGIHLDAFADDGDGGRGGVRRGGAGLHININGGGTVVMKSHRSQQRAAERANGGTLLDLARSSTDATASGLSPHRDSTVRSHDQLRGLSPASPETVRTSANADLLRLSTNSGTTVSPLNPANRSGSGPTPPPPSAFGSTQGNKGRGQFHPLTVSHSSQGLLSSSSRSREARGGASGSPGPDSVLTGEHEGDFLLSSPVPSRRHHLQPQPQPQHEEQSAERRPSPSPTVPEIPHFAKFLMDKEKQLQVSAAPGRVAGKSPTPSLCTNAHTLPVSSDNGEDTNGVNWSHQHQAYEYVDAVNLTGAGSAAFASPRSVGTSPPLPSRTPVTAKGTGQPRHSPGSIYAFRPASASPSSSSSSSEMEAGHASEANFGEDGHYACVPGDTLRNRYILIHQLGLGRSSRVWLAVDLEQCSPSRRHLIKSFGEEKVRRLFNPKERPMFVAIKIFRCGSKYTYCATYESRIMEFIKDSLKNPVSGAGARRWQSLLDASLNGTGGLVAATAPERCLGTASPMSGRSDVAGPLHSPGASGRAAGDCGASHTSLSSWGAAAHRRHASLSSTGASLGPGAPRGGGAPLSSHAEYLALMRDHFTVEGEHGTHHCIVMDVVGAGVDAAINETRLHGLPLDVVRSIMVTSLRGLAVLDALHIIHTDIKPENLLFIDLEPRTADEMDNFQRSRLDPAGSSQLWNSSVHKRISVANYAAAAASLRSRHSTSQLSHRYPMDGSPTQEAEQGSFLLERGGFTRALSFESTVAPTQTSQASHPLSLPGNSPQQPSHSPGESATAAVAEGKAARVLYEVRVSDYGLSFLVPPALREGTDTMRELSQEYIAAQRLRHAEARGGAASPAPPPPPSPGTRRATGLDSPPSRRWRGRCGASPCGEMETDKESSTPVSVSETDDDGDCILSLSPMAQFKAMRRHHQRVLDAAQQHAEAAEAELRQSHACSSPGRSFMAAAGRLANVLAASDREDDNDDVTVREDGGESPCHALSVAKAAQLPRTAPPLTGASGGPLPPAAPLSPNATSLRDWRDVDKAGRSPDPLACTWRSGVRGYLGASANTSPSESVGRASPQAARAARRCTSLGALAVQAERPPSGTELSILRNQIYSRGITVQSREYRAPEVILGFYLLPSCDVWSIGCVAYELVTGHFLFDIAMEHEAAVAQRVERRRARRRELQRQQRWRRAVCRDDDATPSEEEELLHAPLYFDDDGEKDLDVTHLTCMMRLLGPPPLAMLHRTPRGIFVRDFFDAEGNFFLLDAGSPGENEEDELGITASMPYRDAELQARRAGPYSVPPGAHVGLAGAGGGSEHVTTPTDGRLTNRASSGAAATLASTTGNAIVYHYSDDDDDEFEREVAETFGSSAVVRHIHTSSFTAAANVRAASTPSTVPTSPLCSHAPFFPDDSYRIEHNGDMAPIATTVTLPCVLTEDSNPRRFAEQSVSRGHERSPEDSTNYPIVTEAWKELRRTIREHLSSEDEAQSFEAFLLSCLQWDPAKRARAADLLQSPWLAQYGPLATAASLGGASPEPSSPARLHPER